MIAEQKDNMQMKLNTRSHKSHPGVHLFDKTKQLNRLPFRGTAIKETTVFRYQAMNFFECTKPGYRASKTTIFLNTLL
jgi:hypothetical protein